MSNASSNIISFQENQAKNPPQWGGGGGEGGRFPSPRSWSIGRLKTELFGTAESNLLQGEAKITGARRYSAASRFKGRAPDYFAL